MKKNIENMSISCKNDDLKMTNFPCQSEGKPIKSDTRDCLIATVSFWAKLANVPP